MTNAPALRPFGGHTRELAIGHWSFLRNPRTKMLSESPVPSTTESPAHCRRCRAPLPAGWTAQSCPRCLLHFSVDATDPARVFPIGSENNLLGDHDLLDEIARGGMGVVYRARQRRLGRIVAVKVLAAGEFASAEARRRFLVEAEAVARLQHPGIVAIHDVGESEGLPWLSMDFVAGGNLAALVREQPLPARQAAEYVRAIAEAVQHAHDHGVLHRDLKPSNILLDPETGPRITDFGIARCADSGEQTRTGEVLGSPGYTAPEQALGGTADARTDVYGLGALLYHLLTARPPFQGPTLDAIVLQLREADPLAPRHLNPAVPRDLETICLRCLRKEPAHRYATAREVAEDLTRFQRGEPIRARPVSFLEKAWRWCRRRPAIAALLALLAIVATLAFFQIDRARRDETAAKDRAESASTQLRETNARLAASLDTAELDRADDLFRAGESANALALLARVVRRSPANSIATARLASALWQGDFAMPLTPPFSTGAQVIGLQFLRDARTLLVCSNNGITTWDAATGRRLLEFEHDGSRITAAVLSLDERTLAVWDESPGKNLHLLDAATGRECAPPIPHERWLHTAAFSPDSARIVLAGSDAPAQIRDARTGVEIGEPMEHGIGLWCGVFSPDGETIATCAGRTVRWWDARSQELRRESAPLDSAVRLLRFSPDGRWLLGVCESGAMRLFSTTDGEPAGLRMLHDDEVRAATFNADGKRLLTASNDYTARVWSVPGGEPLAPPMRHHDAVSFACFSPDGARIATCSSDHTTRVWDARTARPLTQPLRHFEQPRAAAFTPDGATLYASGSDSVVQRWDLRTLGGPVQTLPAPTAAGVRRSPDGRTLLTATGSAAHLQDAATGQPLGSPLAHIDNVLAAEFSPDGALVATASEDNTARVWDARTGAPVSPVLRHTRSVAAVAFSPDGTSVATASWDGTARLWDARTGAPLARALPHDDHVTDVQFSPDGRRIATASHDKSVRLWDAATGQPLTEPLRHTASVVQVRFHPDGQRLTASTADGSARIWEVPDFSTPPPAWLPQLAEAISLADLPSEPIAAFLLVARYEHTRAEAVTESGEGAYARLAWRLFPGAPAR